MGALLGSGVLTVSASSWFDVERFRSSPRRLVVVRQVDRPTVVLGSSQPESVVDGDRTRRAGAEVVRRRSGGGAVYLVPGDPAWVDVWLPRDDPLWQDDALAAPEWVGEWWSASIAACGLADLETLTVHRGPSLPAPLSSLVCFAGVGPGEVMASGRKVMGLAQWRSRQGGLVHGCAYRHWDPRPLVDLLALPDDDRPAMASQLSVAAIGLASLAGSAGTDQFSGDGDDLGRRLVGELLDHLPEGPPWDVDIA